MNDYERGRRDVMRELSDAVHRFNEDDSMGIGQLIEVVAPFLLDDDESDDPVRIAERHIDDILSHAEQVRQFLQG